MTDVLREMAQSNTLFYAMLAKIGNCFLSSVLIGSYFLPAIGIWLAVIVLLSTWLRGACPKDDTR